MLFNGLLDLPWWGLVLVALGLTHITIAAVTIYLHRNQAHRALDLHPAVAHFFRLWLWMTTGMITKEWTAIHRKHHAKCETAEDPHSPQVYGINRVLWGGVLLYVKESHYPETMERYGHGTPDDWVERNLYARYSAFGLWLMGAIDIALFGVIPGAVILIVQIAWIPFWAAGVINGVGHFFGYRNWDVPAPDASRNISPIGILIGGEELHNNHHAYPASAKFSLKWYEFDLGWTYIRILQAMGLAKVLRLAPEPHVAEPKRAVDGETLQALIANRYDLLAKYARSLKHAYQEEVRKLSDLPAEERARFAGLKRWLRKGDVSSLPAEEQHSLAELMARSRVIKTLVEMRTELLSTWGKSSASREQMLTHLQDWVSRAEASGIRALQETALRIRSYRPAIA